MWPTRCPRRDAGAVGHRDATSARERGTGERRDAGAAWTSTCRIAARGLRRDAGPQATTPVNAARANVETRGRDGGDGQQHLPDRGQRLMLTGGADRVGVRMWDCGTSRIAAKRLASPESRPAHVGLPTYFRLLAQLARPVASSGALSDLVPSASIPHIMTMLVLVVLRKDRA